MRFHNYNQAPSWATPIYLAYLFLSVVSVAAKTIARNETEFNKQRTLSVGIVGQTLVYKIRKQNTF